MFQSWIYYVTALVVHAVALTAFFYREFSTKKELAILEQHLREMASKDYSHISDKIDNLHTDIKELKDLVLKKI